MAMIIYFVVIRERKFTQLTGGSIDECNVVGIFIGIFIGSTVLILTKYFGLLVQSSEKNMSIPRYTTSGLTILRLWSTVA